jgi:hypothetical protein
MNRLIIGSMLALIVLAGPIATELRAEDAHHPAKAAKAKKSAKAKLEQPRKKPAVKAGKAKQSETRVGPAARAL